MLKFELLQNDKHSTNDLVPPKNVRFLGEQIIQLRTLSVRGKIKSSKLA